LQKDQNIFPFFWEKYFYKFFLFQKRKMSYSMSLEKSVRTCDVNVGEANRIQSDRFFNPSNMVCIPWNGMNSKGQEVSPDSWWTKTPGCDSAEDRVMVENGLRPSYINYVTLGAAGIDGHIYGNVEATVNASGREAFNQSRNKITGNFGKDFGGNVQYQSCSIGAYERAQAQLQQNERSSEFYQNQYITNNNRRLAGGY